MPRPKLIKYEDAIYHITVRCNNKDWFQLPMIEVWNLFDLYLAFVARAFRLNIFAFVLMNNHIHILLSTPQANLDQAMNYFLREVSRRIGEQTGRINHIFGGPYHWTLIKDWRHLHCAYKYVYRNPVEANLAKRVELYSYSTIRQLLGFENQLIPLCDPLEFTENAEGVLYWLNDDYIRGEKEAIRGAMRYSEFKIFADPKSGKPPQISFFQD